MYLTNRPSYCITACKAFMHPSVAFWAFRLSASSICTKWISCSAIFFASTASLAATSAEASCHVFPQAPWWRLLPKR